MKERSLNLKPDDIYKQLVLENPDGTLTVRMGKDYEVIAEQCEINIEDNGSEVNVYVSVKSIKSENGKDTDTLFSQRYCRLKDFRHVFDSRLIPAYYNGNEIASVGDTDNWWANVLTTMQMFYEWSLGVGPSDRTFKNDRVANAFRNAPEVKEAREFFYKKYAGVNDLAGAYVSNYTGNFGLKGLFKAGLDPIEQFVGSYRIDINVIDGIMLEFTLTNTTSMKSLLYGIGPDWERSSFRPSGNITQIYIFTEPIR
ncbi:MAG: hypothetical protein LBE91_05505 [Tannerella sp.]|jgi:hypothetical protein|nr:hypothetical protein [Tannerella sp.]